MHNNKGFTLIEVVVALGILIIVFSGTVALVVQVTRLALQTREKTTAVSAAQRALAEKTSSVAFVCNPNLPDGSVDVYNYLLGGRTYQVTVGVERVNYNPGTNSFGANSTGNYARLTATVNVGGEVIYVAKQLTGKL